VLEHGTLDLEPLLRAKLPELHTLSLCETHIPTLSMPTGWTSLRHLASCGLQSLPDTFGVSVPNLRSLNLNYNAIKDLRPLLNISELATLFVAANRLSRLRKTAAVLAKLGNLEDLDLRDNPFTVGFYAKPVEQRLVKTENALSDGTDEPQGKSEEKEEDAFTLPPSAPLVDQTYFLRLDEGTKLRRRVYEMLVASSCKSMVSLDGKAFSKRNALVKDEIWERLVLLGVVRKSEKGSGVLAVEGA
jgi:protein NUD1